MKLHPAIRSWLDEHRYSPVRGHRTAQDEGVGPSFFVAISLAAVESGPEAVPEARAHGDSALSSFASFLSGQTADEGVFRVGPDEFLVCLDSEREARLLQESIARWQLEGVVASSGMGSTPVEADRALTATRRSRKHLIEASTIAFGALVMFTTFLV